MSCRAPVGLGRSLPWEGVGERIESAWERQLKERQDPSGTTGAWENLGTSLVDLEGGRRPSGGQGTRSSSSLWRRQATIVSTSSVSLLFLLALVSLLSLDAFSNLALPPWLASPKFLTLLAALSFFFAVQTYFAALRSLAFYRRFINRGLRHLLELKGESLFRGEKLFRGRRAVIMKIDIADFTKTTFRMPYGMRRLFLDLWFTYVDQVVAHQVFFDKSLGDGSIYCFEEGLPGGSCAAAFHAALEIRDLQVQRFDEAFRRLLMEKLAESEELRQSAQEYFRRYEEIFGKSFLDRRTEVRIALASGYVDEGLWGLSYKSHYDVQGSLPILVTRLEESAAKGEIVFDDQFFAELQGSGSEALPETGLEQREAILKGVGPWRVVAVLPRAS
jgi:class 3 adenylate cyclase